VVNEGFPPPKAGPKSGPAGPPNKKKQIKEFPFGVDGEAEPGQDKSAPGVEPGAEQGQPIMGDDAMKQMQQQQADQQRAEMQATQQKNAEEEQERVRLKDLRIKAEKAVSDDLSDKYLDVDDEVEFHPRMEGFTSFRQKQAQGSKKCRTCGKTLGGANGGSPSGRCSACVKPKAKNEEVIREWKKACKKCGRPLGIDGRCRPCLVKAGKLKEESQRDTCKYCDATVMGPNVVCKKCAKSRGVGQQGQRANLKESFGSKFTEKQSEQLWKVANKYSNTEKREYALRCLELIKDLGPEKARRGPEFDDVKEPKNLGTMAKQAVRMDMRDAVVKVLKEDSKKCKECGLTSGGRLNPDGVCMTCVKQDAKDANLEEETISCPHCHRKFNKYPSGTSHCPHCKQDVVDEEWLTESFAVQCLECGKKFRTSNPDPTCPKCGGSDIDIG
jgi:hypothetical protein